MDEPRGALIVTTTIGCKVACSYCPQGKFTRSYRAKGRQAAPQVTGLELVGAQADAERPRLMQPERFEAYLESVPSSVLISFAGHSEPFLNPHCTELILLAAERGHPVAVNTTLVDFPAKDVARLAPVEFESFTLHLPGFIDGIPNENMPVDAAYLETLEALLDADIPTQLRIHGESTHEDVQAVLDARGVPLERVGIRSFAGSVDLEKNQRFPDSQVRRNTRHKGRMHVCFRIYQNILLPDGDVTLCCQDWEEKHVLGNLGRDRWSDLADSEEMQKIKRGFDDPSIDTLCRVCEDAPLKASPLQRVLRRLRPGAGAKGRSGVAPSWEDGGAG